MAKHFEVGEGNLKPEFATMSRRVCRTAREMLKSE